MRSACLLQVLCLLAAAPAFGAEITFRRDGSIQSGDSYGTVFVHDSPPDQTRVTVQGGSITDLLAYDSSVVDVQDGYVLDSIAHHAATINVHGGAMPIVVLKDASQANIHGGEVGFFFLEARDSALANIYAGDVPGYVSASAEATINIFGGLLDEALIARDASTVNLYGYGFSYDPTVTADMPFPQISGYWLDGTGFTLRLYDQATYEHIRFLPEPATALLVFNALVFAVCAPSDRRIRRR